MCKKHNVEDSVRNFYYAQNYVLTVCQKCRQEAKGISAKQQSQVMLDQQNEKRQVRGLPYVTPERQAASRNSNERRLMSLRSRKHQNGVCAITGLSLINLMGPHGRPLKGSAASTVETHHIYSQSAYPGLARKQENIIGLHFSVHGAFHNIYGSEQNTTMAQLQNFALALLDPENPEHNKVKELVLTYGFFDVYGNPLVPVLTAEQVLEDLQNRDKVLCNLLESIADNESGTDDNESVTDDNESGTDDLL